MNKKMLLVVLNVIVSCYAAEKIAEKSVVKLDEKNVNVGHFIYQNCRPSQEDRAGYGKIKDKKSGEVYKYFGIYDGHCGSHVAHFAHNSFPIFFQEAAGSVVEKMTTACRQIDTSDFVKQAKGGSTACIAIVSKNSEKVYFGNVGDSRAIIVGLNGKVIGATQDHKPTRKDERERIEKNKGFIGSYDGQTLRVNGVLAMTRVLGDWHSNRRGIISDPECFEFPLSENIFLVVASDGLWDKLSNEDVAQEIEKLYPDMKDLDLLAQSLAYSAVLLGSTDNISVLIAKLLKQSDTVALQ